MREVLFKQLTSVHSRKKDIFLKEIFEKDGIAAKTERRCFYFITDVYHLEGEKDLQEWLESQHGLQSINKRHFHILKEHRDDIGEDKVICKIAGAFYAVLDKNVYTIAFVHSFKVCFHKVSLAK